MSGTLAMVLAGGEGTRLMPLTAGRSKPAVPFGGSYRLIDFVLNNFVNSGIISIFVITQYKSQSLYMHLKNGWTVSGIPNCFIDCVPAQMRISREWYQGTADAIYQNLSFIRELYPDHVCVFGSEHIYKMNIRQMLDAHRKNGASLSVAAMRMPVKACAGRFGVIEADAQGHMTGFAEKPEHPATLPGDPGHCLISVGNYIFNYDALAAALEDDQRDLNSSHDFGKDVIPKLYKQGGVMVYDLADNHIDGEPEEVYWRDVGSIDAYFEAHMDLLGTRPKFTLQNPKWPLPTFYPPLPPANFTDTASHRSQVSKSLISAGCEINGATIENSVLGFRCSADDGAEVLDSVLLGDAHIGRGCRLRRAIIDRNVHLAPGFTLGVDERADSELVARNLGVSRSPAGIMIVPRGLHLGFSSA